MINLAINKTPVQFKVSEYSGGEPNVLIEWADTNNSPPEIDILMRFHSSLDLIVLGLMIEAIGDRFKRGAYKRLIIPYTPFGRQDRRCNDGEAFSLKFFANYINAMGFNQVDIYDPHSDVTTGLINNSKGYSLKEIVNSNLDFINTIINIPDLMFVSPDAGANKKVSDVAGYFNHTSFIRADKVRDLQTRKIVETKVFAEDLTGVTCFILDDILDYGGTFIALAKELKRLKAEKVFLFVTHGIFAGGTQKLFEAGIDRIYTTNSYYEDYEFLTNQAKPTIFKIL